VPPGAVQPFALTWAACEQGTISGRPRASTYQRMNATRPPALICIVNYHREAHESRLVQPALAHQRRIPTSVLPKLVGTPVVVRPRATLRSFSWSACRRQSIDSRFAGAAFAIPTEKYPKEYLQNPSLE
jgi:hypothetical protein